MHAPEQFTRMQAANSVPRCAICDGAITVLSARTRRAAQSVALEFVHHDGKICTVEFTHERLVTASRDEIAKLMQLDNCLRALPPHLSKFARRALRRVSVGHVEDGDIGGSTRGKSNEG